MKKFDKLVQEAINRIPEDEVLSSDLATIKGRAGEVTLNGTMKIAGQRAEDYKKATHTYRVCSSCSHHLEKSSGRYPSFCPSCGDKVDDKDIEQTVEEGTKEEYQEFFQKKLKQWKVKSPSELSDEDKKSFFAEVEKEYKKEDPKNDDGDK